ncbi:MULTISPECIES: heme exporter protein CcmB [Ectothiorhodospira]|uniref:heme exporter protein CcmB n=1 Tax=Ectothiorhodospira TaxID=1051 RepID=UPI0004A3E041|nr:MULTISPECIES: heme exporter protein CcmB [Ectothiorhodospira]MCG5493671.1 heme exporter protein CcmB [Ectothiorhodospira variabilis]MCG5497017.1 heme exporter protein CcmB [Ectothiorhodospira variabilis]MCG5503000.1 heme exporter protein CcmB [Ectothiorhodospira variabilis]MCG5506212.1 heme exporter protein CcmB [Ectothiorhodospira variabilis]MCG5525160.1 heme exporter protein CcmB [Ectothiorhodospira haloalkaliphila]
MSALLRALMALLRRDLLLAMRRRQDALVVLGFFVVVVSLFPLGVGPDPQLLRSMAPGVLWVSALLATMLSLERLFADDFRDGSLEQLLLTPQPLPLLVLMKILAHWLVTGLPLVLISPLLGMQLNLDGTEIAVLMMALLLGTPILSLVGAIGAGLTLGLRGGGVLISLLILPLYVPALIMGAGAVDAVMYGSSPDAHLSLLAALLIFTLLLAPWAIAAALRIMLD